jgi:hypothetical protein
MGSHVLFASLALSDLRRMGKPLPPAITVLLPSSPAGAGNRDSHRLRNVIDGLFSELHAKGMAHHECAYLVSPLLSLAGDPSFQAGRKSGVAMFLDGREFFCFDVPPDVAESVTVGQHYHVRPLLDWLAQPNDFLVLEFAANEVRLLQCRNRRLKSLPLPSGTPCNLDELASAEIAVAASDRRDRASRQPAISFGLSSANTRRRTRFFCTMLDRMLHNSLLELGLPIVVTGNEDLTQTYLEENTYPHAVAWTVRKDIAAMSEPLLIEGASNAK